MFDFEWAFIVAIESRSILPPALLDGTAGWGFLHSVRAAAIGYYSSHAV
jgi:hypothetical protein